MEMCTFILAQQPFVLLCATVIDVIAKNRTSCLGITVKDHYVVLNIMIYFLPLKTSNRWSRPHIWLSRCRTDTTCVVKGLNALYLLGLVPDP